MNNSKNVENYIFGKGAILELPKLIKNRLEVESDFVVYFIDHFFQTKMEILKLEFRSSDEVYFVDTTHEPKTEDIDNFRDKILELKKGLPKVIVGIGGGITLDTGKAVSNLLTNGGKAEDYQGWDLVKVAGVYKIGVPTISGTGAEASRTCVMTNSKSGLKLGMNSNFTIYNQLVLDPNLTKTVPKDQYFYTGMDTYIHCVESLNGNYRNAIGDAYSQQAIQLVREVFHSDNMMSEENREKLMVSSYLGGCAIANSFVGVIHPFSAGLSVVLGTHHCIGNCITMNGMKEFYPKEHHEFIEMAEKQGVEIPQEIAKDLIEDTYKKLYKSTIIHEKPLKNALGENFKEILTISKVEAVFKKM